MVDYQEVVSNPAEHLEQKCAALDDSCPLRIELADGTVLKFDYIGSWFWNAWYYLAGRCTRVMLNGKEIPVSSVNSNNIRLPRQPARRAAPKAALQGG